ncbi:unnamed protein product [Ilex paraguariensis]|uniref:Uncharacterized protein n=1 Tax=Ilex paraguariensis TaxID=185542 RepID=A0ABC8TH17_9AQUA
MSPTFTKHQLNPTLMDFSKLPQSFTIKDRSNNETQKHPHLHMYLHIHIDITDLESKSLVKREKGGGSDKRHICIYRYISQIQRARVWLRENNEGSDSPFFRHRLNRHGCKNSQPCERTDKKEAKPISLSLS